MSDDSRIHLLNNGISDRQKKKVGAQNATLDELAALGNQLRLDTQAETITVCEHYMSQIPELVAHMLGDAFAAHGIVLQPPPQTDEKLV